MYYDITSLTLDEAPIAAIPVDSIAAQLIISRVIPEYEALSFAAKNDNDNVNPAAL